MKFEFRKYCAVNSETTTTEEYTPANGEMLFLTSLGGDAATNDNVKVKIIWDTETLFTTHTSNTQPTSKEITGDGTKKLSIILDNQSSQTEEIGGFVLGNKYV